MDATQQDAIERKLRWERDHLSKERAPARNASTARTAAWHAKAAQQEQSPQFLCAEHAIEEIDAALGRLANGQYGTCLACGRLIAVERLQLVPATRFCLRCARKSARPALATVREVRRRLGARRFRAE